MSGSIRAVARDDLTQVVELYQRAMRSEQRPAPPGLAPYFERTLLDQPWADPEIPSLVYEADDGRILGFIGSHVRRLNFDQRPIRMGVSGQLVSDPAQRHLAVGAMLMRRYLSGAQDLTITDGATELVHEMWARLGGYALQPESVVWTRLLRPSRAVGDRWLERTGRDRWRNVAWPIFSALDAATSKAARPSPSEVTVEAEELTAEALIEHQPEVLGDAAPRIAYDPTFVEWLFRELTAVRTRGTLERRLLRQSDRVIGWYIAYMRPRGLSVVLEVAAVKGAIGSVLDRLFLDAWETGAVALEGRLEPALFEPLSQRRCLLRYGTRALFHSRDPEVTAAMALGKSGLTRLHGEWWMGYHTEPFV